MRAYYKDGNSNRICIVCDTLHPCEKVIAVKCAHCGISFRSAFEQYDLLRMSNERMADSAVEDVLLNS